MNYHTADYAISDRTIFNILDGRSVKALDTWRSFYDFCIENNKEPLLYLQHPTVGAFIMLSYEHLETLLEGKDHTFSLRGTVVIDGLLVSIVPADELHKINPTTLATKVMENYTYVR